MSNNDEIHRFDHIINLPHQVSKTRKPMSAWSRAAQFSPFAALTGYDDAVKETARLTADRMELDEETKEKLSRKLNLIQEALPEHPEIEFTYFVPDQKKTGGEYTTHSAPVKKIDLYQRIITLMDGTKIPIDEIADIDGELFLGLDDDYL
ncbi:MAG: hypothetical protein Q4B26_19525 [Eubacteriales bacterium]|nr:hypothetical protein [Eubacteriales bacterium]